MPKKLADIKIENIDAVDNPANDKKFLVVKSADGEERKISKQDIGEELGELSDQDVELLYGQIRGLWSRTGLSSLEDLGRSIINSMVARGMNVDWDDPFVEATDANQPEDVENSITKKGGKNMDLEELLKGIEDEELRERIKEQFEKSEEDTDVEDEPEEEEEETIDEVEDTAEKSEDVEKEAPEEYVEKIQSLEQRVEQAEEIAKKEREKRKKVEFKKKAQNYDRVAQVDKIQDVLFKLHKADSDLLDDVTEILKSAQERLKDSGLFKEAGDSGEDATGAETELEKKAEEIAEKEDITKEKAFSKAMREHPELYERYLEDK